MVLRRSGVRQNEIALKMDGLFHVDLRLHCGGGHQGSNTLQHMLTSHHYCHRLDSGLNKKAQPHEHTYDEPSSPKALLLPRGLKRDRSGAELPRRNAKAECCFAVQFPGRMISQSCMRNGSAQVPKPNPENHTIPTCKTSGGRAPRVMSHD